MATLAPLLYFRYPLMVDFPNHLSRLYILSTPTDSLLSRMYSVSWSVYTNVGIDLFYRAIQAIVDPLTALKFWIFGICVGSFAAGWSIQRALYGRISFSIAVLPLLLCNFFMSYGFLNYLMGVSIGLLGIALFINGDRTLSPVRMALLALIGAVALLCHVLAFAGFMLAFVLLAIEKVLTGSRGSAQRIVQCCLRAAVVAVPGMCLYLFSEKFDISAGVSYDLLRQVRVWASPMLATDTPADALLWIGVVLLGYYAYRASSIGSVVRMQFWRPGIMPCAVLAIATLVGPYQIGEATAVGVRLLVFPLLLAPAMMELRIAKSMLGGVFTIAVLALLVTRGATIGYATAQHNLDIAEFVHAAPVVDPGVVLVAADSRDSDCREASDTGVVRLAHLGSFLTIKRQALVPITFAGGGMQPIRIAEHYRPYSTSAGSGADPVSLPVLAAAARDDLRDVVAATVRRLGSDDYFVGWPKKFGYVLMIGRNCHRNPLPAILDEAASGRAFVIYRVRS